VEGGELMPGAKGRSGGRREGAGRKRIIGPVFRRGEQIIVERQVLGGAIGSPELAVVLSVSVDEIELQIGDDILVLRVPEAGEVANGG
jgi:hypothetical protein